MLTLPPALPAFFRRLPLLVLCLGLSPAAGRAAVSPSSREAEPVAAVSARTRSLIGAFRSCCAAGAAAQAACAAADDFFAFSQSATDTLEPLAGKLKPRQRRSLVRALEDIFRAAVRQSGGAFCAQPPTLGNVQAQPSAVTSEVLVLEPGEDVATKIAFVWRRFGGAYRAVDLLLEGGSLVADYQNQFSRIVAKDGVDGLVQRVEARRAKAASASPAAAGETAR